LESKPSGAITVSEDSSVAEAIKIMTERNISAVMVVDKDDKLTGMFTERDALHCIPKNVSFSRELVKNVMGRDIISFEPSTEISAAISVIARKQVRHIPVVEGGRIVGIVTYRDLVSYVLPELIYMAEDMY
jgi:CBS domain-containing protein